MKPRISFFCEDVKLEFDQFFSFQWLERIITSEDKKLGEISFIFCDDNYLLKLNQQFLDHDTFTDIISFDYSLGNIISGDIYISIERVKDNASIFAVDFAEELRRVMAHGILHFCGFNDKTKKEEELMRRKENEKLLMFHVEH